MAFKPRKSGARQRNNLERQFTGLRFRVVDEQDRLRRHVRFFVNGDQVFELAAAVGRDDEIAIVQALSGG